MSRHHISYMAAPTHRVRKADDLAPVAQGAATSAAEAMLCASPIDAQKLAALEAQFGEQSMQIMVHSIVDEAETYLRRIRSSLESGDLEASKATARRLAFIATKWGAYRLAAVARSLESNTVSISSAAPALTAISCILISIRLSLRAWRAPNSLRGV